MNKNIILYGIHACFAALKNPERRVRRICVTERNLKDLPVNHKHPTPKVIPIRDFDKALPKDSVHQGIYIETEPLPDCSLKEASNCDLIVALDQVTDPHNVGAIIRSCAAFGAGAILFAKDNAPTFSGALAKSASGTLEIIKTSKVTNLARSLEQLKKDGFWVVGLDGNTDMDINKANLSGKIVLVMGSEGKGLRKLTKNTCDMLVRLPMSKSVESLNVSNAAAIALYEIIRDS
jgi:23S rRNA (guanosine2251-2'-O)-methyltransferase